MSTVSLYWSLLIVLYIESISISPTWNLEKNVRTSISRSPIAPGRWVQAEERAAWARIQHSIQRTPRNIQRCRWVWIWKNHWPLTVPWGLYRQRHISWCKGASLSTYIMWSCKIVSLPVLPKVEHYIWCKFPSISHYPLLLFCFWQSI